MLDTSTSGVTRYLRSVSKMYKMTVLLDHRWGILIQHRRRALLRFSFKTGILADLGKVKLHGR